MSTSVDNLPQIPLVAAPPDDDDAQFDPSAPAPHRAATSVRADCANCGASLLGPHCYACGQPVKGMVRHLSSILSDAADTILNVDSRIFRSLWPLLVRPGFLTVEYFAGRRVRYVTPFRLYFFLSVASFFLMQFMVGDISSEDFQPRMDAGARIEAAMTVGEVTAQRDAALADLEKQKAAPQLSHADEKRIDKRIGNIRSGAEKRLAYLKSVDDAKAKGEPAPADPQIEEHGIRLGKTAWDPKTKPIHISGLPQIVSDKANQLAIRAQDNVDRMNNSGDYKPLALATLSALPQVLFVLMPLFALMLKIFYIFKRRLYMEHLIVALHSHAFIFLALFLLTLTGMARSWAAGAAPWLTTPLGWMLFALGWWLPIYLLIMQKKVYKQGWILTAIKYATIGIGYTGMISIGSLIALLVGLATT